MAHAGFLRASGCALPSCERNATEATVLGARDTGALVGGTFMVCSDCGDAVSMNTICKTPLQSETDMLKHMAVHNASRAFAPVGYVIQPEPEADPSGELVN